MGLKEARGTRFSLHDTAVYIHVYIWKYQNPCLCRKVFQYLYNLTSVNSLQKFGMYYRLIILNNCVVYNVIALHKKKIIFSCVFYFANNNNYYVSSHHTTKLKIFHNSLSNRCQTWIL
jgi:hypothetical protein